MKRFQIPLLLATAALLLLVGCAGEPNWFENMVYDTNPSTNTVAVWTTNNGVITVQGKDKVTYRFEVKPTTTEYLRLGQTVVGTFGPQFAAAFGIIGAGLAGWAGLRNRKLNATVENQTYDMQVAREIIKKVTTPEVSAELKAHLISSQKADGVKSVVEDAVDKQKGDTGPEAEALRIISPKTP